MGSAGFQYAGAEDVARCLSWAVVPVPDLTIKVAKYVPGYGPEPGNKTLSVLDAFPASPCDLGESLPLPLPRFPQICHILPQIRWDGSTAASLPW